MTKKRYFWALDTSWLCNLFYFAGKSNHEENSGIRGFLQVVCKILNTQRPAYLVAAIDSHLSFRRELCDTYKGQRKDKEDNYIITMQQIKEALDILGIPQICVDYYEADDVLATLAEYSKSLGIPYVCVTKDKDFRQCLVTGKVGMYNKGKESWSFYGEKELLGDWGITPAQAIDYQCMVGDAADNIKGVEGIGPTRATELLQRYGTLEGVYENLSDLSPTKILKFEKFRERLDIVRKLVTLKRDVASFEGVLEHYETRDFTLNRAELDTLLTRNDLCNLKDKILRTWENL